MGFSWARPTSFVVGPNVTYYAVDHRPSYLWDSVTWQRQADQTVRRAIEILDGTVLNPKIPPVQNRRTQYPHARRARGGWKSA